MHVDDFDDAFVVLARRLAASGVQYVVLEDDDDVALTIVPGPSQRNLERLARVLKSHRARMAVPGPRLDYDELIHGGPGRWPLLVADATIDVIVVDVADGRWATYYHEALPVELDTALEVHVVPEAPVLSVRRGDARDAMPELALSQRQRDRLRLQRRRGLLRNERRAARRETIRRLAGRR